MHKIIVVAIPPSEPKDPPYSSYCKPIDDTILTSEQQQFVNNYIYKYYVKSLFNIDANNDTVGYYSPVYLYLEKISK